MSTVVVVTGMHRSGTSLFASLIRRGGVDVGEKLLAPNSHNPRGFFEDRDFVEFHEEALGARDLSIFAASDFIFEPTAEEVRRARQIVDERATKAVWGWKDPRTSLFLDFWRSLLPEVTFVFLYRRPIDVLFSLVRRRDLHSAGLVEAVDAWCTYNSRIAQFCRRYPRSSLLCHTYSSIDHVDEFLRRLELKSGLRLDLRSDALAGLYYADELKRIDPTGVLHLGLGLIHPESVSLYAELNQLADLCDKDLPDPLPPAEDTFLSELERLISAPIFPDAATRCRVVLPLLLSRVDPDVVNGYFRDHTVDVARLEREALTKSRDLERAAEVVARQTTHTEAVAAHVRQLEQYIAEIERIARERAVHIEHLEGCVHDLTTRLAEQNACLAETSDWARTIEKHLHASMAEYRQLETYVRGLERALAEQNSHLANVGDWARSVEKHLQASLAEYRQLETYVRELERALAEQNIPLSNASEWAQALERQLQASLAEYHQLEAYVHHLEDALIDREREIDELKRRAPSDDSVPNPSG